MKKSVTNRGFHSIEFKDKYERSCSLQESSLATEPAIWLGVDDANPKVLALDARQVGIETNQTTGWIHYPVPSQVSMDTRMHLTQQEVRELLPYLQRFAETGELLH